MLDLQVLTEEQRAELDRVATVERFAPGDALIEEGSPSPGIFILRSGQVAVEARHLDERVRVHEMGPGELFGEICLVEGGTASATCSALDEVEVAFISRDRLDELIGSDATLAAAVHRSLATTLAARVHRLTSSPPLVTGLS